MGSSNGDTNCDDMSPLLMAIRVNVIVTVQLFLDRTTNVLWPSFSGDFADSSVLWVRRWLIRWTYVSKAKRVGVFQYLSTWFDFGAITNDPMPPVYWASLNNQICMRYRGRKNIAKTRLTGFEGDVEATRAQAHVGMDLHRWSDAIDHFLTEKHKKRSAGNKECRKKQVVKNHGGTYQYTHHITDSSGDTDTIDWITILEKVLDTQRGHVRDIGPKHFSSADVNVNAFLQNPAFVTAIGNIIRSFKNQVNNDEDDADT
ncbi:unnamed protein product [Lactuca saligna]|uniref:Uncharacterized protein n=1 Tax=Lactuca saligna TaxID=75948 RepID=A0AA35Y0W2_LACSI|nr:unnamed protein product [Lactuca saligna]